MVKQSQKGFTLLEMLVSLAIAAMIVPVIAMSVNTLLMNSAKAAEQNTALPQVQSAGYWVSRDVQMSVNLTASDPNGFPLSLDIPIDLKGENNNRIDYLLEGNKLKRKFYDSSEVLISETLVATYIDGGNTTFNIVNPAVGFYRLTVTASRNGAGVTRTYEITKRVSQD